MWFMDICKKVLRFGVKILLLPVFLLLFAVKVLAELLLNLSSWVVGLAMMVFLLCIGIAVFNQEWSLALIILVAAVIGILMTFAATAVVFAIGEAYRALAGFMAN